MLYITIHNANKVTFDGRDCFIVTLCDIKGMLFHPASRETGAGHYDEDAVSEHPTIIKALEHGVALAKKRGIDPSSLERRLAKEIELNPPVVKGKKRQKKVENQRAGT
jgi:hypothetical protein